MRLSVALLLLALAACTPDLPPDEAFAQAREAIEAGDASEARRLLHAAAADGHLDAIGTLARSYQTGYFRQSDDPDRPAARFLPTRQSDWEAQRWTDRYFALLRQPTEDPTLLWLQAQDLLGGQPDPADPSDTMLGWQRGAPDASPAQRAAATAILDELIAEGDARAAHLRAWTSETDAERTEHLDRAVALGSPQACFWQALGMPGRSAEATVAYLDAFDACAEMPGWRPPADYEDPRTTLQETLQAQVTRGNSEARVLLDSLHALGAFPGG